MPVLQLLRARERKKGPKYFFLAHEPQSGRGVPLTRKTHKNLPKEGRFSCSGKVVEISAGYGAK
jgi:hypothetical protein